jgi:membrane peptidoglycan carboxypeptidase
MPAPRASCCSWRWRCRRLRKPPATGSARDDFAVTFLDRYGNEIGHRGIIHEDSAPVDQLPDHFIKAVLATEDRRFFEHFGIDFLGLARAMTENVKANRWSRAAPPSPSSWPRTCS